MSVNVDGIDELIVDLSRAGLMAGVKAAKVLNESGKSGVKLARSLAPTTRLPHYATKITHEVKVAPDAIEVEWGPEKGGQGNLGHILEKGSSVSPPHAHLGPSLDVEGPRTVKSLAEVLGDL